MIKDKKPLPGLSIEERKKFLDKMKERIAKFKEEKAKKEKE